MSENENPEDTTEKLEDAEGLPGDEGLDLDESLDLEEWSGDDEPEEDEAEGIPFDAPQFVDNGDGTISDSRRHLMWQQKDSFFKFGYGINWYEANDYIEELNEKKFAGFDDWRLCSFDEAQSMFSFSVSSRDKDGAEIHIDALFDEGGGHNTWTYEEKPDYSQFAMHYNFITGNEKWENKDNEFTHVRAVRDEMKEEWEPAWRQQSRKFD